MTDNIKGFVDIHSHLLPIQDGPENPVRAIRALRIAEANNITDIIFTPHYYSWDTTYNQKNVEQIFQVIKEEISRSSIKINIYLGNECAIDERIIADLKERKALTLNNTDYVLCEYPLYQVPWNFSNILYELIDNGYKPIIAHPERNIYIESNYGRIQELKRNGCLVQINAASVLGKYGRICKRIAAEMLKDELVEYVASDSHSEIERAPDVLKKAFKQTGRWVNKEYLIKLFVKNAGNLIG